MAEQEKNINELYYIDYFSLNERSTWVERIWKAAFGEAYPEGLHHYGYFTKFDLEYFVQNCSLNPDQVLLDIGCGKGGPGLKIAEITQAKLLGIDIVPSAIEQATLFQNKFDLKNKAEFAVGEFKNIPLEDGSVDCVISIDAFWTASDKMRALKEVKRVLKPNAKFIFTNWDLLNADPIQQLKQSGLSFISRIETHNWKTYQEKVYEGINKHKEELVKEMGAAANMLLYEATASPPFLDESVRRIYVMENS